jgi:preprotein translocase subunit SecD
VLPNAETCPSTAVPSPQCRAYTSLSTTEQTGVLTALSNLDCGSTQLEPDVPTNAYYACDDGKTYGAKIAYLLGAVIVKGSQIDTASAQAPSGQNGQVEWTVALTLGSSGADQWSAWTSKYNTTSNATVIAGQSGVCAAASAVPCSDFVAFTLDGQVISSPITQAALSENTQISGNFTPDTARSLAQELNYGKLPVSFHVENNQHVSATLGSAQLKAAFLAGGIGLLLVVIYSLIYYRGLGLVTIASLMVSAGLTYAMLVILGVQIGFTLDLAGIAGFIVALGITADSFVVFFERLKDEVHEGRSSRVAVPRAWVRARRTILSADTVSFLAAAILYYFASADVKGFAFTLGMSTILDIIVVFLFTHPIVAMLSRSRAFGSARFTGLDSVRGAPSPDAGLQSPRGGRSGRSRPEQAETADYSGKATLVLDKNDDRDVADEAVDEPGIEDSTPELEAAGLDESGDVDEADDVDEVEDQPRRRVAPEPGSAAERAAARRARMRDKKDGDR